MEVGDVVKFVGGVRVDGGATYRVVDIYRDNVSVLPIRPPLPGEPEPLVICARNYELEVIAKGTKH